MLQYGLNIMSFRLKYGLNFVSFMQPVRSKHCVIPATVQSKHCVIHAPVRSKPYWSMNDTKFWPYMSCDDLIVTCFHGPTIPQLIGHLHREHLIQQHVRLLLLLVQGSCQFLHVGSCLVQLFTATGKSQTFQYKFKVIRFSNTPISMEACFCPLHAR